MGVAWGSEWGLNENESEVKVVGVGAAADHPGGTLEQDARLDGERSSNHYRRRDKEREGGRGGWRGLCDTHAPSRSLTDCCLRLHYQKC